MFHLVLIAERFDESMVLMKRLFGWTMKDIVYRKLNSLKPKKKKTEDPVPDLNEQLNVSITSMLLFMNTLPTYSVGKSKMKVLILLMN